MSEFGMECLRFQGGELESTG